MKKIIMLLLLLTITGCNKKEEIKEEIKNKTIMCQKEEILDDIKATSEYVIDVEEESVKRFVNKETYEMNEDVDKYIEYLDEELEGKKDVKGLNISINKETDKKYTMVLEIDYKSLDTNKMKEIINEDNYLTKKDISYDEFIEEVLSDYNCEEIKQG